MLSILFVEDESVFVWACAEELAKNNFKVIEASSIKEAEAMFNCFRFDAIVMDACVPGSKINTLELTKTISTRFKGPLIAISSSEYYRKLLKEAGCNHSCQKEKLVKFITELFDK